VMQAKESLASSSAQFGMTGNIGQNIYLNYQTLTLTPYAVLQGETGDSLGVINENI
jgi:hypothetical protein